MEMRMSCDLFLQTYGQSAVFDNKIKAGPLRIAEFQLNVIQLCLFSLCKIFSTMLNDSFDNHRIFEMLTKQSVCKLFAASHS